MSIKGGAQVIGFFSVLGTVIASLLRFVVGGLVGTVINYSIIGRTVLAVLAVLIYAVENLAEII